jgi:hypothetical protein
LQTSPHAWKPFDRASIARPKMIDSEQSAFDGAGERFGAVVRVPVAMQPEIIATPGIPEVERLAACVEMPALRQRSEDGTILWNAYGSGK